MGCTKSSSKREVYSNAILPQEIRKTYNRQPKLGAPLVAPMVKESACKDQSTNKWKRSIGNNNKDHKTKSGPLRR